MNKRRKLMLFWAGVGGPFTPAQIAGLVAWYKADALALSDGAAISSWTDSSGNTNHATQGTGTKQPTYKTNIKNGMPVARFDGGDGLQTPAISLGAFTVFVVFSASANGLTYEHGNSAGAGTPGSYMYTDVNASITAARGATATQKNRTGSWGIGSTWRVVMQRYGGTHATHEMAINGAIQSMSDGVNTSDPGTGTTSQVLNIGSRNASSLFLTGDIAELLVYNAALTDTDRGRIETYLNGRYAIF